MEFLENPMEILSKFQGIPSQGAQNGNSNPRKIWNFFPKSWNSSLCQTLPHPIPRDLGNFGEFWEFQAHLGCVEAGAEGEGQAPVIHGWGGKIWVKKMGIGEFTGDELGKYSRKSLRNSRKYPRKNPRKS